MNRGVYHVSIRIIDVLYLIGQLFTFASYLLEGKRGWRLVPFVLGILLAVYTLIRNAEARYVAPYTPYAKELK